MLNIKTINPIMFYSSHKKDCLLVNQRSLYPNLNNNSKDTISFGNKITTVSGIIGDASRIASDAIPAVVKNTPTPSSKPLTPPLGGDVIYNVLTKTTEKYSEMTLLYKKGDLLKHVRRTYKNGIQEIIEYDLHGRPRAISINKNGNIQGMDIAIDWEKQIITIKENSKGGSVAKREVQFETLDLNINDEVLTPESQAALKSSGQGHKSLLEVQLEEDYKITIKGKPVIERRFGEDRVIEITFSKDGKTVELAKETTLEGKTIRMKYIKNNKIIEISYFQDGTTMSSVKESTLGGKPLKYIELRRDKTKKFEYELISENRGRVRKYNQDGTLSEERIIPNITDFKGLDLYNKIYINVG